jgi:hypothetical protein
MGRMVLVFFIAGLVLGVIRYFEATVRSRRKG